MDNWGFENGTVDDGQGNNSDNASPGGLRKFAEAQQKENQDLKAQLAQIQQTLRNQQLSAVFNDLGAPEALSQYQGEADPTKAKTWLEEQRRIFGGSQGSASPAVDEQQQASQPALPPMIQQQFDQFSQAGQTGTPLGSVEQAYANVNDAKNLDALIAAMKMNQR